MCERTKRLRLPVIRSSPADIYRPPPPSLLAANVIARFTCSISFVFSSYFTFSTSQISRISSFSAMLIQFGPANLSAMTTNCPMRRWHFSDNYSCKNANKLYPEPDSGHTTQSSCTLAPTFFPSHALHYKQCSIHFIENICFNMTFVLLFRVFFLFSLEFCCIPGCVCHVSTWCTDWNPTIPNWI